MVGWELPGARHLQFSGEAGEGQGAAPAGEWWRMLTEPEGQRQVSPAGVPAAQHTLTALSHNTVWEPSQAAW